MGETVRAANGQRRSPFYVLTDEDIEFVKGEIRAIGADERVFIFNEGDQTAYWDKYDHVTVVGDIFPSGDGSIHPRDLMSVRAVLAHEYYGHRPNKGTSLQQGAWLDEFRASYRAAADAPGLCDEDRFLLVSDAIERAKVAGVNIKYNSFIRRILYGY